VYSEIREISQKALRMGWGIYHDQMSGNAALLIAGLNPPYQETCTLTGTSSTSRSRETTVRHRRPRRAPLYAVWQRIQNSLSAQLFFDIQHELWKNTVVTGGYYGSLGRRLIGYTEYNNLPPGYATQTLCAQGVGTYTNPQGPLALCQTPNTALPQRRRSWIRSARSGGIVR